VPRVYLHVAREDEEVSAPAPHQLQDAPLPLVGAASCVHVVVGDAVALQEPHHVGVGGAPMVAARHHQGRGMGRGVKGARGGQWRLTPLGRADPVT